MASDDSYTVEQDTNLTVNAPGFLGNDVDPDSDMFTAVQESSRSNGLTTLAAETISTDAPTPVPAPASNASRYP